MLKVRNLKIGATVYPPNAKPHDIEIVHGVSFNLERGKVLGLIGESGAGKSTIGLSAMLLIINLLTIFPFDTPTKTSAPRIASSRVVNSVLAANSFFSVSKPVLFVVITP